jgi:hypothetical protein
MGSNGKKKTTVAKMNRENKVRERRAEKKAKKDARKLAGPVDWFAVDQMDGETVPDAPLSGEPASGDATDPA